MKKLYYILLVSMISNGNINAQDNCKVMLKSIQGSYTGECLNGLANGLGRAVGIDTFDGEFIKGLPEGKGMYIWKDGHYFIGKFKNGKMEGEGDMYFESSTGQDSVISGFWKKDKYIGAFEKEYLLITNTSRITKVEIQLVRKLDLGGINISIGNTNGAPPSIASINIIYGQINNRVDSKITNTSITRISQMIFPFRAIFYLTDGQNFEAQFNEKGNYEVFVTTM